MTAIEAVSEMIGRCEAGGLTATANNELDAKNIPTVVIEMDHSPIDAAISGEIAYESHKITVTAVVSAERKSWQDYKQEGLDLAYEALGYINDDAKKVSKDLVYFAEDMAYSEFKVGAMKCSGVVISGSIRNT